MPPLVPFSWSIQPISFFQKRMTYPAAEQRGIYKGNATPQAAGN
jgi:hypothetical protein